MWMTSSQWFGMTKLMAIWFIRRKDLVLTFVDNHQRLKAGVDDVITGKGTSSKAIYHVIPANKILQQARDLFFF
jgi:hypothetical protein